MPRRLKSVLDAWREAERRLGSVTSDDPARPQLEGEVDRLRSEYQALVAEVGDTVGHIHEAPADPEG